MEVKLSVKRFNPDSGQPAHYYQEYELALEDSATVLDGLIKVREEIDGTLALRCSCRSAICGSCAMRINGHAALACKTKVTDAMSARGGPILVEPPGNMQVVKDLVVDFAPFWDKVRAVKPWLQPEGPEPEQGAPRLQRVDAAPCGRDGLHHVWRLRLRLHGAGG